MPPASHEASPLRRRHVSDQERVLDALEPLRFSHGRMKAEQHHFQQEPFGEVEPIPYRARFSLEEFQRITECLTPGTMEDKWFVYFREPSLACTGAGPGRLSTALISM